MIEITFIVFWAIMLIIIFSLALKKNEGEEKEAISYVFINQKTKKYHQKQCPYSNNLNPMDFKIAIKEGYTPCQICNNKIYLEKNKKEKLI